MQRATADSTAQVDPPPDVSISALQGAGARSPFEGQIITTVGVVTARTTIPARFFMQVPDAETPDDPETPGPDDDPATSEGVVVRLLAGAAPPLGTLVSVTGTVTEIEPDAGSASITELHGVATPIGMTDLPQPVELTAGFPDPAGPPDQLERLEAMRVYVASLTVVGPTQGTTQGPAPPESTGMAASTGVFYAVVTGVGRPFREPGVGVSESLPPDAPANVPRFDENPERLRVASTGLTGATRMELETGDRVTCVTIPSCINGASGAGLTGVLDFDDRTYTLLPDPPPPPLRVLSTNRLVSPLVPPAPDQLSVATFNLRRLFDAVDDPAVSADVVMTAAGYNNRLNKLTLTIRDFLRAPDIIAVQEVENESTLRDLGMRLGGYSARVLDGNDAETGLDVGVLVKESAGRLQIVDVVQEGKDATFDDPATEALDPLFARPPLVLRAVLQGPSGTFLPVTIVVVQLHPTAGANESPEHGRARRAAQAEFLASLIQARQKADRFERIITLGDFAAFEFSDGLVDVVGTIRGTPAPPDEVVVATRDLVEPDLANLVERLPEGQRYSVVGDGNAQAVDHMLVTSNLLPLLDGVQYARFNADFPELRRNTPTRPERFSNHDPLVAYFSIPASVSIDDVTVTEGDLGVTEARFTVTVQRARESEIRVAFETEDGDAPDGAKAEVDYTPTEGILTFQAGETTQTIQVDVIGDRVLEPHETFRVRLTDVKANASITRAVGTGTILNDDAPPALTIEDASVDEHDKFARVKVTLPMPAAERITVNFATEDGTATDGVGEPMADYVAAAGTLVFDPGDVSRTIEVALMKDRHDESAETFFVNLSDPTNATIGDGQAIVTIRDDDRRPAMWIRNAREVEPQSGTAVMTFHVELSARSGRPVTVDFRTRNLGAVAGQDYVASTGTLTFAPGETKKSIVITLLADDRREHDEAFAVKLSNLVNARPVDPFAIGLIEKRRKRRG